MSNTKLHNFLSHNALHMKSPPGIPHESPHKPPPRESTREAHHEMSWRLFRASRSVDPPGTARANLLRKKGVRNLF